MATAAEIVTSRATNQPWPLLSRIGFRFCLIYFGLFCLLGQIINAIFPIPKVDIPDLGTVWPIRRAVFWVGTHVFGMQAPLVYSGSGSGDKHYDWVLVFCILIVSVVATGFWSLVDRKPRSYDRAQRWFWLFLRFSLASQMLLYGLIKAFPLQMRFPPLVWLVEPFGNFSPMAVLWGSIGASPAYETFAGCAELLGAILLMFPRTVTLGALVSLADMSMVFALNMTYDVPVKLLSLHLVLIALLLLSPDYRRLVDFFILGRPTEAPRREPLFASLRARRIASGVIVFLWLWMIGDNLNDIYEDWHKYGPGAPKSALYGIWDIASYSLDDKPQPLTVTDGRAWRRLIFENPQSMSVQLMDTSRKEYGAAVDPGKGTLALTDKSDKNWKASFAFTHRAPDQLGLNGTIANHKASLELHRFDEKKLELLTRGFHWVQDYPYTR
ncbi:DoxX family protein [Acidobacteria bacterium AB60]|nr:DoxX family protein [Acidobacteria bacterium AB60]